MLTESVVMTIIIVGALLLVFVVASLMVYSLEIREKDGTFAKEKYERKLEAQRKEFEQRQLLLGDSKDKTIKDVSFY